MVLGSSSVSANRAFGASPLRLAFDPRIRARDHNEQHLAAFRSMANHKLPVRPLFIERCADFTQATRPSNRTRGGHIKCRFCSRTRSNTAAKTVAIRIFQSK